MWGCPFPLLIKRFINRMETMAAGYNAIVRGKIIPLAKTDKGEIQANIAAMSQLHTSANLTVSSHACYSSTRADGVICSFQVISAGDGVADSESGLLARPRKRND